MENRVHVTGISLILNSNELLFYISFFVEVYLKEKFLSENFGYAGGTNNGWEGPLLFFTLKPFHPPFLFIVYVVYFDPWISYFILVFSYEWDIENNALIGDVGDKESAFDFGDGSLKFFTENTILYQFPFIIESTSRFLHEIGDHFRIDLYVHHYFLFVLFHSVVIVHVDCQLLILLLDIDVDRATVLYFQLNEFFAHCK